MVSINLQNVFDYRDNCYKPSVNTMMTKSLIKSAQSKRLTLLAKDCKNIDEVREVLKNNNKNPIEPTKQNSYFVYISIRDKEFILSYDFSLLNKESVNQIIFRPYIEFDIDEIRLASVKLLECELFNSKDVEQQIEVIEKYIKKPDRRFKKWDVKPKKIFLYHSYNEDSIGFPIL